MMNTQAGDNQGAGASDGRVDDGRSVQAEFAEAGLPVETMAAALEAPLPAPARLAALRTRVLSAAQAEPFHVVPWDADAFRPFLPGISIRPLRVDRVGGTQTSLWRLAPGARIPAHPHRAEEECLVVEGTVLWAGTRYGRGDFLVARAGAHHDVFESPDGALLLIRSELTAYLEQAFSAG